MRVDEVPSLLAPLYQAASEVLGRALAGYFALVRKTSRVEVEGDPSHVDGRFQSIHCVWHENWIVYASLGLDLTEHVWINHPVWYMLPIHVAGRRLGIHRMLLGSTGHGGRRAAEELVHELRRGRSSTIFPDGPAGPRRGLRAGVLHVALQSGVPIVPIAPEASRSFRLPTWDRKVVPLPFGTLRVRIGAPIAPSLDAFDDAGRVITSFLDASG